MRVLQEIDRKELLRYLQKEPEMNLFLIGDMENYGINSEAVNFYLHEERERWDFVILRFHRFYILYSPYPDYNSEEAVRFLKTQNTECISGKTNLLRQIACAYPDRTLQSTFMSRLNRIQESYDSPKELEIRRLTKNEVPEAIELLSGIEEFAPTYQRGEKSEHISRMAEEMEQGGKLVIGGYVGERLVVTAQTSAENSQSAMIVGVATEETYRGKGYASAAVSALCRDCFERGKEFLCLFYDNPQAGRIYSRIGFQEMGEYGMLR